MEEFIKRAKKRIKEGDFSSESWRDDIFSLEKEINDLFTECCYVYKGKSINAFEPTPEKILKESDDSETDKKEHEQITYNTIVQNCMETMRKYLRYYNIGFITDFSLTGTGVFQIQLSIDPNDISRNYTEYKDKRETKWKIFLKLKEILQSEGFTLDENVCGVYFPDTESNKQALLKVLKPFSSSLTDITCRNNKLQTVSLLVWPSAFEKLDIPEIKIEIDEAEEIENKKNYISGLICDLKYGAEELFSMTDYYGNLMENSFADLCTALNINTDLSEKVKGRYDDTKLKSVKSEFAKRGLTHSGKLKDLQKNMHDYYDLLKTDVAKQTGLSIYDLNVRENNYDFILSGECITAAPPYEEDEDDYGYEKRVKKIKKNFHKMYTFVQDKTTKEKFIAFSDKNLKKIENIIKKLELGSIHEIKLENLNGQYWIKEIKIAGTVLPDLKKGA